MGNRIEDKNNDEFLKAVHQMRKSRNEFGVDKVSTHLEQRYKDSLMQSLRKQQMSKSIKRLLADCIQKKIKKQDLTSTIAVLNSLRSNNAEQLLKTIVCPVKETDQSKNVVIKYDKKKPKFRRTSSQSKSVNNWYREQDTLEGRVKYTGQFICKQLNKSYHPFRLLCKRFTDIINTYEYSQTRSANERQYQNKQELQRKDIKDFCLFLVAGCVNIYRKWIIEYTGLEDKKYQKWMYSLVLNQIWAVNQASMSTTMLKIISKAKIPLKINFQLLSSCSAIGIIHPKDFSIDNQFQIQGNYFISIYTLSTLSQKPKPIQLLKHLQNIQKSICLDIDNYHKLQQKGQVYQINADNIMGIVAYILTKNTNKIEDISNILLFLKMIYGQGIFYNMDTSSYMYSTIWSAIQYIETKKFQLPKNNQNQIDKQLKDTNCAESSSSFISHKSNNFQQPKNVQNLQKQ